ncbi:MAG: DUF4175 family protein [Bacteroidales bacterium]
MPDKLNTLLNKIDRFIRRYYLNQLIRGILFFLAGLLVLFLAFITIEHLGYFGQSVRFVLFYSFILFNVIVLIRYVIIPLMGMIRLGKRINPMQAARILEKQFPEEIQDTITNVLQLRDYLEQNPENAALIMAGIDQKAEKANIVPFQKAIPLKGNLRFVPYVIVPLVFFAAFYLLQPEFILEPATRIVQYDADFERPRPFTFSVESPKQTFKHEDYELQVVADGHVSPTEANVIIDGNTYMMKPEERDRFSYTIRNVQDNVRFYIESQSYRYGPFRVAVVEKPSFNHFHIAVDYPDYTGLSDDTFNNMGDLSVIHGSTVKWTYFTNASGQLQFYKEGDKLDTERVREGEYRTSLTADQSFEYTAYAFNEEHGRGDSLSYYVQVTPDEHPRISVEEHRDDVLEAHLFYRGNIEDDFGLSQLKFYYRIMDQQQINRGDDVSFMDETIAIDTDVRNQTFNHHFDLSSIYIQPGETIELYFEVFDNDPINGPKSSTSPLFAHYIPSKDEILTERRENEEQIDEGLRDGAGEVRQSRDQVENLRKELLDSEQMGWEQRDMFEELLEKQQEMEQKMEELSQQKKESEMKSEQFMDSSEEMRQKQEELQELFDEVMTDEMKELFEQLQEELDKMDRDEMFEQLDEMDFELQDMERRMDRALEMFRQFAMERLLDESINRLQELAEEQQEIMDDTGEAESGEEVEEAQDQLQDAYEQVKDMMDEFRETNEQLSMPHELDDTKPQEEDISEDLQDALDQLQQDGPPQDAMPSQQDAGNKMQELSEGLQQMQDNLFQEQLAEDARAIRTLLENLLRSSFSQEDLMDATRQANTNDPQFVELISDQRKIQSDMEMIEDSLVALSQRQMAVKPFVNRELAALQREMERGIDLMINRRRNFATSRQQLVMTHINNLALMLNESLQDIQQQMAMGQGMSDEMQQGEGEPSFQNLREMQEQLNEMLEQARDGHQPEMGETGQPSMSESEQMARMAAEQEAIRQKLKELTDQMKDQGEEVDEGLGELQREMEESELDMLRKELSSQTMERQERILTRLLEHERAERQQDQEDRREGTTAEDYDLSNPEEFFEYNREREREIEMLRSVPPGLRPFYRSLVEKYFLHVE